MAFKINKHRKSSRSWDSVAEWYTGWVGPHGSVHHRQLAIPSVLRSLQPCPQEHILDVGCGSGVLAPYVFHAGAHYTGVDASAKLIAFARKHHQGCGTFLVGNATRLHEMPALRSQGYDAAVFMLSVQDIYPLDETIAAVTSTLVPHGRIIMLMTHPCFRVPRQSGWGWDPGRKLQFRRIDRYLSPLIVPRNVRTGKRQSTTQSYHRPLGEYVRTLVRFGFTIDALEEIPVDDTTRALQEKVQRLAAKEIPLFLTLRARRG